MQNQKVVGVLVGGVLVGAALGAGVTMSLKKKSAMPGDYATCSVDGGTTDAVLFELDGQKIKRDDLGTEARDVMYQIENQGYESKTNYLKEFALRYALAKDKDKAADIKDLPPLKTLLGADKISEDEMKKFFEANKKSLPPGTTFAQIRPQLEQFMLAQRVGDQARQKVTELESSGRLKLLVPPPVSPKVSLDVTGFPTKGAATAPVTLVEVSDYLCPHCRSIKPEVESVVQEFGSKIRFVQVNFALRPTGLSGALARGGFCASKQGEDGFWKYHDKAFQIPLEAAQSVSPDEAKEFNAHATTAAKDAGLDVAAFEKCLTSDEAKQFVDQTNTKMNSVGVSGTPTFFINERKVSVTAPGSLKNAVTAALEGSTTAESKAKAQ